LLSPQRSFLLLSNTSDDLLDELVELRLAVLGELLGIAELDALATVHDHYVGTVDDGVDPVGDGEDSGVLEVLVHHLLDAFFRLDVDVGSGLIQHDNFVVFEDSSSDANQLLFTCTQALRV